MKSPRFIRVIQSPSKRGRELDVDLNWVRREFVRFYEQKLQDRDIGPQVRVIAEVLDIEPPTERRLEAYPEWLRTHWGLSNCASPKFARIKSSLHELVAICLWYLKSGRLRALTEVFEKDS
jgi:hypothetical protein